MMMRYVAIDTGSLISLGIMVSRKTGSTWQLLTDRDKVDTIITVSNRNRVVPGMWHTEFLEDPWK